MDTDINNAGLFEKLEDHEEDILESEELQCNVAEQICQAKKSHTHSSLSSLRNNSSNLPVESSQHSSQSATEQIVQPSSAILVAQPS